MKAQRQEKKHNKALTSSQKQSIPAPRYVPKYVAKQTPKYVLKSETPQGIIMVKEQEFEYISRTRSIQPRLCCREQFFCQQTLLQPESKIYEYKMFHYPLKDLNKKIILRTITSLLNGNGGFIFMGVKETHQKRRIVQGVILTQIQRELIHKDIRQIVSKISPSVQFQNKINVSQIPIRENKNVDHFLKGKYVVKISVLQGNPQILHSFIGEQKKTQYYTRINDQCVSIPPAQVEQQIKRRSDLSSFLFKSHQCPDPFLGNPLYDKEQLNPISKPKKQFKEIPSQVSDEFDQKLNIGIQQQKQTVLNKQQSNEVSSNTLKEQLVHQASTSSTWRKMLKFFFCNYFESSQEAS